MFEKFKLLVWRKNKNMQPISEFLRENIEPIVKSIVDSPECVDIKISLTTKNINVEITSKKQDYGKIIGKNGKTINALKIIVSAMKNTKYSNDRRAVSVEIMDDDVPSFNYQEKKVI